MIETIYTCDCCLKKLEQNDIFEVSHCVHVAPDFNRMKGHVKVVDEQFHAISRRQESKQFCLPCYNDLFEKFFKAMKERQISLNNSQNLS